MYCLNKFKRGKASSNVFFCCAVMCSFVLHTLSYLVIKAKTRFRRLREEAIRQMHKRRSKRFLTSKKALAVPLTYMILFASLMVVVSLTYSFAITRISARSTALKISVAKQNMQALDNVILSTAWSFGASETVYMDDCGSIFKTEPTSKSLVLNLTDKQAFSEIIFNGSVGKAFYELEPSENYYDGLFLRGDSRAIINESAYTLTQLYFEGGNNAKELVLCYRPLATSVCIGMEDGKPLNLLRTYILNLNNSQNLALSGKFYLKVTSLNVTVIANQYEFDSAIPFLALTAETDEAQTTVELPIISSDQGAIVNLEVVICNVEIQKVKV